MHANGLHGTRRYHVDVTAGSMGISEFRDKEVSEKTRQLAKDFQGAFKNYKALYKAEGESHASPDACLTSGLLCSHELFLGVSLGLPDATKRAMARAREDFPEVDDKRDAAQQEEDPVDQGDQGRSMEEVN